ncbi:hypothetical protein ACVWWK_006476 [Bradyrhizobium sp. LB9.1b]
MTHRTRVTRDLHVVLMRKAEEHAGVGPNQAPRITTRMLGGFPSHLKQQPVLWVHGAGLGFAGAEKRMVEARWVVKERAPA